MNSPHVGRAIQEKRSVSGTGHSKTVFLVDVSNLLIFLLDRTRRLLFRNQTRPALNNRTTHCCPRPGQHPEGPLQHDLPAVSILQQSLQDGGGIFVLVFQSCCPKQWHNH